MEKCNVLDLVLTKFDRGPKWLAIPKKSTCRDYLSNGNLNIIPNFNFEKVKKSAFLRTWFDQPQLSAEITRNSQKYLCLLNGHLNLLLNLISKKLEKSATF